MVELKPSQNKLVETANVISSDTFEELMDEVRFRYIDLVARGSGKSWLNNESTVVFELRSPAMGELVALTSIIAKMRPASLDYMYGTGEHCIVYTLTWGG